MGKTAPLKKNGSASVHSRAAKRASSPSIDTDKSLKNVKPPTESKNHRPSVLAVHQGAGVTKRTKNGRKSVLSAKAKRRQEKGLDRAEAVMDKKEKKIEKSRGRARNVQERAKAWDDLNKKILAKKAKEEALLNDEWVEEVDDTNQMEDVDDTNQMDDVEIEEDVEEEVPVTESVATGDAGMETVSTECLAQAVPLPEPVEEDEIL